jgi:hypothetical protein
VIVVPLLLDSFFDGEYFSNSNVWLGILFGVSVVFCTLPILTFPFAPPEFLSPHNDFWIPLLTQEGWYVPNLANVLGAPPAAWTLIPVLAALAGVVYYVTTGARLPRKFLIGLGIGFLMIVLYAVLPLRSDEDAFRQATISERFFRPADRLAQFEQRASAGGDVATLRRINEYRWNIADTRSYAPNGFPYQSERDTPLSPRALMKEAIEYQKRGEIQKAEIVLRTGKNNFSFAACEFGTNLAVLYYTAGRKNEALTELENVQPLVFSWSQPDCVRSRQLVAELRREMQR